MGEPTPEAWTAELAELTRLREHFRRHHIFRVIMHGRGVPFIAHRAAAGVRPHTVITEDLAELRDELERVASRELGAGSPGPAPPLLPNASARPVSPAALAGYWGMACEVSWFSALCDDDYEFLGVPKLHEYMEHGLEAFILSGYPHAAEADLFARHVLPHLDHAPLFPRS